MSTKSVVTGKMSNRVMNMKFMKHAENKAEIEEEKETKKKLKDSSEWELPNKIVTKPKAVSVGHAALQGSMPTGRRSFKKEPVAQEPEPEAQANKTEPKEEEDLDKLFKKRPHNDRGERSKKKQKK